MGKRGSQLFLNRMIEQGKKEAAEKLLDKNIAPTAIDPITGRAALHEAIEQGCNEIAEKLIDEYAITVNQEDSEGHTPLYYSVQKDNLLIFNYLISHHANMESIADIEFSGTIKERSALSSDEIDDEMILYQSANNT